MSFQRPSYATLRDFSFYPMMHTQFALHQNLFFSVCLKIFHTVRVLMDQDLTGVDRGTKGLVSNINKKSIQPGADRHIEKGAVDQPPSGKSHAHIAQATNDVRVGVI